jgi:hypothetical protein
MKKIGFIFFFSLLFLFSHAQQKKDSIVKKSRFFTVNIATGVAWREYDPHVKNYNVLTVGVPQPGETPGSAYSLSFNYGRVKRRCRPAIGVAYDYAKYNNYTSGYAYSHHFLSLNYSFFWYLDKPQNWRIGGNIEAGWIMEDTRKMYDHGMRQFFPWSEPADSKYHMEKHPTGWAGIFVGRRLLETKKIKLFIDLRANVSSRIGYKTVGKATYPYGNSPTSSYGYFYESKPRYLMVSSVQFTLLYKL